jgi:hypothetical protein
MSGPRAGDIRAARVPTWLRVLQARSSDVRAARAHTWTCETEGKPTAAAFVCPGIWTLTVPFEITAKIIWAKTRKYYYNINIHQMF